MKKDNSRDERLLEAIDFIDSDLIAETAERLMQPVSHKKRFLSTRRLALIAACIALIALALPTALRLMRVEVTITQDGPRLPIFSIGTSPDVQENRNEHDGSRGLTYTVSEDGTYAILTDIGFCTDKDIVIASTYNGYPVKEIYNGAITKNDTVESVTIPDSVETVRSFHNCPNLRRVYIGAGVREISFMAFTDNDLHEVIISPENPYFVCRNSCVIEVATKTIVFGYRGAVIPDDGSVERIMDFAFCDMKGIDSIVIPEGIKYIGGHAFEGCEFKSIVLPKSLEYLSTHVFGNCKNLEYFDLGGYKELPEGTLFYCNALREVVGLENVTRLGRYALDGNYLTSIKLTSALQYIDEYAFGLTDSLGRVYFDGTVAEWNAIPKGYHWNYNLPATNVICNDGKGDPSATMGKK